MKKGGPYQQGESERASGRGLREERREEGEEELFAGGL